MTPPYETKREIPSKNSRNLPPGSPLLSYGQRPDPGRVGDAWSDKGACPCSGPERHREQLPDSASGVENLAGNGGFSLDALNDRLKGAASNTVNAMFRAKIAELEKAGRVGSMLVYDNVLKGLERFAGERIQFDAVTVSWLKRYADFLTKEGKVQTTISIHLRHLRAIMNDARRLGIVKETQYPFGRGRYEIQEGEGRKLALTLEQIGRIARYEDGSEARPNTGIIGCSSTCVTGSTSPIS